MKYVKRMKISNQIDPKKYLVSLVSITANAQNHIQIKERQPKPNSGFFKLSILQLSSSRTSFVIQKRKEKLM